MKLKLKRISKQYTYTIGQLFINGVYFCDTIEDKDRGLDQSNPISIIDNIKVPSQTAIPTGIYKVSMNTISPRLSQKDMYKTINGKVPRLLDVPGFDGVLIHIGNTNKDTSGCILVGQNKVKGQVINSKVTFFKLYKQLEDAVANHEQIIITIQ